MKILTYFLAVSVVHKKFFYIKFFDITCRSFYRSVFGLVFEKEVINQ